MSLLSTNQAAKRLGIGVATLTRYIQSGKVPAPPETAGGTRMRLWNEEAIQHVRQLLPKIANGRKTRYTKLREKQKAQTKTSAPRKPKKK
jgi:excisionase family DNA binding protein